MEKQEISGFKPKLNKLSFQPSGVPAEQPFQYQLMNRRLRRGRWNGGEARRWDFKRDSQGKAEGLIALLYREPRSTRLGRKHGHWFQEALPCRYHQGALISGIPLNEADRRQRRKDLEEIRDELQGMMN